MPQLKKSKAKPKKPAHSLDTETAAAVARAESVLDETTTGAGIQAPATDTTGTEGEQSSTVPAPTSPSADSLIFGSMLVDLSDRLFVRWAGDGAAMSGVMRTQAADAWGRVLDKYLPTLLEAGPLGQLALIYTAHATTCFYSAKKWTHAPLPESSANEGAEKPPS